MSPMSAQRFRELDTVEVLVPLATPGGPRFAAGIHAAIVDLGPDDALVEIVETDGHVHGPYGVAFSDLRLISHAPAPDRTPRAPAPAAPRAA